MKEKRNDRERERGASSIEGKVVSKAKYTEHLPIHQTSGVSDNKRTKQQRHKNKEREREKLEEGRLKNNKQKLYASES